MNLVEREFEKEFIITATRSSGAGGQNVNKVNTKIELRFNVIGSKLLSEEEKIIIQNKLSGRISNEGFLIIQSQTSRSQLKNKLESIEKFYQIVSKALKRAKKRTKTKPSLASKSRRLEKKKIESNKKMNRKRIRPDE